MINNIKHFKDIDYSKLGLPQSQNINWLRYSGEQILLDRIAETQLGERILTDPTPIIPGIRQQVMSQSVRLNQRTSPELHYAMKKVQESFQCEFPYEIYQIFGDSNASSIPSKDLALLQLKGNMLTLLDDDCRVAILGHELGHSLLHNDPDSFSLKTVLIREIDKFKRATKNDEEYRIAELLPLVSNIYSYYQAREITADRCEVLAAKDLWPAVKLSMVLTTGLGANTLSWDIEAYLEQCRESVAIIKEANELDLSTHPENAIRAYAAMLFWESDLFHQKTGLGPGTRPIEEVDKEILSLIHKVSNYEEQELNVPQEVLLASLATCVILSFADGDISEPELDAIEETFSDRVEGYQDYLQLDKAWELLDEVAPICRALGEASSQIIFLYAIHVIAADGIFHPAEISGLLKIGKLLNRERHWLKCLRKMNIIDLDMLEELEDSSVNIPKRNDTISALDAFLSTAKKRGKAKTSVKRLIRLLGKDLSNWKTSLSFIAKEIGKHKLTSEPPLDSSQISPDSSVVISSKTTPEKDNTHVKIERGEGHKLLEKSLTKLQTSLISGDGRSPSIRTRGDRLGRVFDLTRLDTVSPGLGEQVETLIAEGREATLITPQESSYSSKTSVMSQDLEQLARENHLRQEEKGACDLYLGTKFIVGCVKGYEISAPLVLRPVDLERIDGAIPGWKLKVTENRCLPNYAVLRLISNRKGSSFSDEIMETLDAKAEEGADALVEEIYKMGFFSMPKTEDQTFQDSNPDENLTISCPSLPDELRSIEKANDDIILRSKVYFEPCAAIGFFPQSSSDIINDYDNLLKDLEKSDLNLQKILCGSVSLLPDNLQKELNIPASMDSAAKEAESVTATSLDPSQKEAVKASLCNQALVVDGPPGTGKSQVILGLIMDSLAKGKHVAVVSDKRAALDVVAQRLTANDFGASYGIVHDIVKDRPELFARIAKRMTDKELLETDSEKRENLLKEQSEISQELKSRSDLQNKKVDGTSLAQLSQYVTNMENRLIESSAVETGKDLAEKNPKDLSSTPPSSISTDSDSLTNLYKFSDLLSKDTFWADVVFKQCCSSDSVKEFKDFLAWCKDTIPYTQSDSTENNDSEKPSHLSELWFKAFQNSQDINKGNYKPGNPQLMFTSWDELLQDLPKLISLEQSFLRWFNPTWWKLKGKTKEWLAKNDPQHALDKLTAEMLNDINKCGQSIANFQQLLKDLKNYDKYGIKTILERLNKDAERLLQIHGIIDDLDRKSPCLVESAKILANSKNARNESIWRLCYLFAWSLKRIKELDRELDTVNSPTRWGSKEETSQRLGQIENEVALLQRQRIINSLTSFGLMSVPLPKARERRTEEQKIWEEISKEVNKKSRRMPMRTFVRKFAKQGLLDIMPVWLLSPETMSVLFPREPIFDLVIFDEASQSTVANSLPVLLRTNRWVIAGDDKQMPPTSFFTATKDNEDVLESEESSQAREVFDGESLLTLARSRVPHIRLTWHYRCQDEALIAFSNYAFYEASLGTIPIPPKEYCPKDSEKASLYPINWVGVEAVYDNGRNPKEADLVATLIAKHLADTPNQSIGVITFNIKQRLEILDAIDRLCQKDPTFRSNYLTAIELPIDRRPFVKSLENVQGDERDHIIFSLGHAPVQRKGLKGPEWKVPARFGPLARRGGERRLNVAVSRARLRCTIAASFNPSQLSVGNTKYPGPKLFKLFLEYAWSVSHGENANANNYLNFAKKESHYTQDISTDTANNPQQPLPDEVPLAVQIAIEAEKLGFIVEQELGTGSFKVPLALFKKNCPPLAILIDDGSIASSIYDLHVHRPNLLRSKGWRVLEISPCQWLAKRSEIINKMNNQQVK